MCDAERHRGPDDAGLEVVNFANPAAVFGHRRLSIIDLSPAGHQPMVSPETGDSIVLNGEIYNCFENFGKSCRPEATAFGQTVTRRFC